MSKYLFVGLARLEVHIPEARSLKEKRSRTQSLLQRIRSRHHVLATESRFQDLYQRAEFAICGISTDEKDLRERLQRVRRTIDSTWADPILAWDIEILEMENSE